MVTSADNEFEQAINNLDNISISFDTTFTNTVVLPLDSLLIYKGVSFLNTNNVVSGLINYPSALAEMMSVPVGASANNAVIFGLVITRLKQLKVRLYYVVL